MDQPTANPDSMKPYLYPWLLALGLLQTGCSPEQPAVDADVIVIGAGIAGIAAALEASDSGAQVLVLDVNSVGGGHAVMAGGLFLVDTPLQAAKGVVDSPDLAFADIMAWGEDGDPQWVRRYVESSRTEVHDWLTSLGVEFNMLLPAPGETSVPRFHFARGGAANVVLPMLQAAVQREEVSFLFNTEASGLHHEDGTWLVATRNRRSGSEQQLRATAVVIATGGFENDLDRVRANWPTHIKQPETLLAGAGHFATGSGLELAAGAGAAISRLDHQTIFVTGLHDPRDPLGRRGMLVQNPAAVFVSATGQRFVDESSARKTLEQAVLNLDGQSYWMIFDSNGLKRLQVRGAPWLNRNTIAAEVLGNPALVQRADTPADLAAAAGLPATALLATIRRYNEFASAGSDPEFGRAAETLAPLLQPPYHAIRLYPMTRKSMGGIRIDSDTRVLATNGEQVPGLFAAGEVTGVAGINGSYGGSGTFLGPSVLTGRIAGEQAASRALAMPGRQPGSPAASAKPGDNTLALAPEALDSLLATSRRGYWHFEQVHGLVRERGTACETCHVESWGTRPAITGREQLAQLVSCASCH